MLEQSEISTSVTEVTTIKSETVVNGVHAETGYSSENSGQENVQNPLLRAYSEPDLLSASSDDRQVKADDAFPFPIFFKRSKKDPGSKLHDALVEELSSVLQKRKLQKRSSGLWEVDEESNETKYKSIREQRQQERSAEKITSVFANKELLSRLESHFAGKIQSQKQANSPQPKEEKSVNGSRRVGTGVNVVETKSVVHVNGAKNFETGEYGKSFNEMPNESNNGNDSSSSASDSLIGRDSKNTSIIVSKTREITFGGEESDSDGGHGYRSFTLGGRGHRNFHASDSNRSQTLDRSYKHVTKINVSNGHVSGNIPDHKHKHDDDYHHQNVHRHNSVNIRVDSFHDNHHHDHHHRDNYHHGNNGHDNYGPVYSTMVGRDGHIERQTSFNSSSKITRFERASIKSEDGQVSRPSSFVIRRGHASDPESDEPTWRTIVDHRNVSQTLGNSGSWVTLVDQSANSAKESDVFRSNSQRNVKKVHNLGQTDQKLVTATAFSHDNDTEVHITAKDNNQQKMYVVKLPSSQALSQPIRTSLSSPLQMSMSTPIRTSMSPPIRSSTLKYGGSPFTQEIGEGALPTAHGDGLYRGEEDKPATFYVEASGMTGEPNIQVDEIQGTSVIETRTIPHDIASTHTETHHTTSRNDEHHVDMYHKAREMDESRVEMYDKASEIDESRVEAYHKTSEIDDDVETTSILHDMGQDEDFDTTSSTERDYQHEWQTDDVGHDVNAIETTINRTSKIVQGKITSMLDTG